MNIDDQRQKKTRAVIFGLPMQDFSHILKAIGVLHGILEKHPGNMPHGPGTNKPGQESHNPHNIVFGLGHAASIISILSAARDLGYDVPGRDDLDASSDQQLWDEAARLTGSKDNAVNMIASLPKRQEGEALRADDVKPEFIQNHLGAPSKQPTASKPEKHPMHDTFASYVNAARAMGQKAHGENSTVSEAVKNIIPERWAHIPSAGEVSHMTTSELVQEMSVMAGGKDSLSELLKTMPKVPTGGSLDSSQAASHLLQFLNSSKAGDKTQQAPKSPKAPEAPKPAEQAIAPHIPKANQSAWEKGPAGSYEFTPMLGREASRADMYDRSEAIVRIIANEFPDDPEVDRIFEKHGILDPQYIEDPENVDFVALEMDLLGTRHYTIKSDLTMGEGPLGSRSDVAAVIKARRESEYVDRMREAMSTKGISTTSNKEAVTRTLFDYTGAMSGALNVYLASGRRPSLLHGPMSSVYNVHARSIKPEEGQTAQTAARDYYDAQIKAMDEVVDTTPVYDGPPITLFYGASNIDPEKLTPGRVVVHPGFMSTSIDPDQAQFFDNTKPPIRITVTKDSNLRLINVNETLGKHDLESAADNTEEEFIIPRSARLRVDKVDPDGTIHLTVEGIDEKAKDAVMPYSTPIVQDVPETQLKDKKQVVARNWYQRQQGFKLLNLFLRTGEVDERYEHTADVIRRELNAKPLPSNESGASPTQQIIEAAVPLLDRAIENNKLKNPLVVYRGIKGVDFTKLQPGVEVTLDAYTSTSVSRQSAEEFGHVMHITLPVGQSYLRMPSSGMFSTEQEVLLPRNQRFVFNYLDASGVPHFTAVPSTPESSRLKPNFSESKALEPVQDKSGILDYSGVKLEGGTRAGGSNDAKIMHTPDGVKYLVKGYGGDKDRMATELVANAIYRELGVRVPEAGKHENGIVYPLLDGKELGRRDPRWEDEGWRELGKSFMVDALLANRDMVGLDNDNVLWDDKGPIRIDQGGTLAYRAMGGRKPFDMNPQEDIENLRLIGQAKKFDVTYDELKQQAAHIAETLTPDRIEHIVQNGGWSDLQMKEDIRNALLARVKWMDYFSKGKFNLSDEFQKSLTAVRKRFVGHGRLPLTKRGSTPSRLSLR